MTGGKVCIIHSLLNPQEVILLLNTCSIENNKYSEGYIVLAIEFSDRTHDEDLKNKHEKQWASVSNANHFLFNLAVYFPSNGFT